MGKPIKHPRSKAPYPREAGYWRHEKGKLVKDAAPEAADAAPSADTDGTESAAASADAKSRHRRTKE